MIIIERFCDHDDLGCFGQLYIDGEFVCNTVEQPWRNNVPFKSCVPVGSYDLVPFQSPKYGAVVALHNPSLQVHAEQADALDGERFACLIHAANWAHQLQGCIAPGDSLSWGSGNLMVTNSRTTLADLLARDETELLIRWKHG